MFILFSIYIINISIIIVKLVNHNENLIKMPKKTYILILKIITCLFYANILYSQQPNTVETKDTVKREFCILKTWSLPGILKEISGISYLDADRFVCVQDETGSLFIYNINTSSIESTIPFATPGDYEGVALVGDDAYIACADGRIIEITGYRLAKPVIKEYGTHLTVTQNVEGICYDRKNKRLLVAIKGEDEGSPLYKGIYEFSLVEKKMAIKPVFKIDLQDPVFASYQTRKVKTIFQPSEIDIDPVSGDMYITSGIRSQILIMNSMGKIKALYALDKTKINQPEGMLFTPSGDLYIASEGGRQTPGKIFQIQR
jgi:uncharacterized protein YjiK